jgi:hypothetical protein
MMIRVQEERLMKYDVISADGHVDLIWLPPDLFTKNASARSRTACRTSSTGPKGPEWVSAKGAKFGLVNGMGSAGREYVPGVIHRSDRMASTGLYDDGKKGIRRLTEVEPRLKDQDRDGVQAEILYGVLGSSGRLNDPKRRSRCCASTTTGSTTSASRRPTGWSAWPTSRTTTWRSRSPRRCAAPSAACAASTSPTGPTWCRCGTSIGSRCGSSATRPAFPLHFHTIGGRSPDYSKMQPHIVRRVQAVHITGFQMHMSTMLMGLIFSGAPERYPNLKIVIGEAGLGWIPYVLQHMDLEWEDQFQDLELKMKPSEYWYRQFYATYQTDPVGIELLDHLGEDNVMWGSDFPHPDGIWPDSQEFLSRELTGVSAEARRKIVRDNALKLYRLGN